MLNVDEILLVTAPNHGGLVKISNEEGIQLIDGTSTTGLCCLQPVCMTLLCRNPSHSLWRSQREKRTDSEMDYSSVVDLAVGSFYVIPIIRKKERAVCPHLSWPASNGQNGSPYNDHIT
jgi:hypothetical protein